MYTGSTIKETTDSENRLEEDGSRKREMLIVENGELARQSEQHVQRLRGENEAGRFTNKEDSMVGA